MWTKRDALLSALLIYRSTYRRIRDRSGENFKGSLTAGFLAHINEDIDIAIMDINISNAFNRWRFIRIDGRVKRQLSRKNKPRSFKR